MPKRIPTPPPPDDEPKYLVVFQPYPASANMELEEQRRAVACWLACCIGKHNLYAIHHKPAARNMIIIEVNRYLPDFTVLLGAHNWNKFLKKPKPDEVQGVSQVFYCKLSDGRKVQKSGWKRVAVEENWFDNWSPINQYVVQPYPATHYCEPPTEDVTQFNLCCTLPVASFPPPPPARPPPVGSPEWIKQRDAKRPSPQSVWDKNILKAVEDTRPRAPMDWNGPSPISGVRPGAHASAMDTTMLASLSAAESASSPTPAWGAGWSSSSMGPPGLASPPGLSQAGQQAGSSSSSDAESIATPLAASHDDVPFAGLSVNEPEYFDDEEDPWMDAPTASVIITLPQEDISNTQDGPQDEAPTRLVCPAHGTRCKRGICTIYSKFKKEVEREKRRNEREKNIPEGSWRNKGRGKGGSTSGTRDSSSAPDAKNSTPRQKPAHLTARAKPPHLQRAATTTASAPAPPVPVVRAASERKPGPSSDSGWGTVSNGPWSSGATVQGQKQKRGAEDTDTRSVAESASSGWGTTSIGPWETEGQAVPQRAAAQARTQKQKQKQKQGPVVGVGKGKGKSSWADEMDEEDARSVVASTAGGWGACSDGPW